MYKCTMHFFIIVIFFRLLVIYCKYRGNGIK